VLAARAWPADRPAAAAFPGAGPGCHGSRARSRSAGSAAGVRVPAGWWGTGPTADGRLGCRLAGDRAVVDQAPLSLALGCCRKWWSWCAGTGGRHPATCRAPSWSALTGSGASQPAVAFAFAEAALRDVSLLAVCALADSPGILGGARLLEADFEEMLVNARVTTLGAAASPALPRRGCPLAASIHRGQRRRCHLSPGT
jgi:hypothetical protein